MSRAHSEFPASAAKALMACPGRFGAVRALGPQVRTSSAYAAQGTAAHKLAEDMLNGVRPMEAALDENWRVDGHDIEITQDMIDATGLYVQAVEGLALLGYEIYLEVRVSPNWLWPAMVKPPVDLFGTADCLAYNPQTKHLIVCDLKFGRGEVNPEWNPQLLYYAVGAFRELDTLRGQQTEIRSVETVIVQPNLPHKDGPVRRKAYTSGQVLDWGHNKLVPAVHKAVDDGGKTFVAGEHCQFCPLAGTCEALRVLALDAAKDAFAGDIDCLELPIAGGHPLEEAPADALSDVLTNFKVIRLWMDACEEEAVKRLSTDERAVPGYKLVQKRATRKWKDAQAAQAADNTIEAYFGGHIGGVPRGLFISGIATPAQVLGHPRIKSEPELLKKLSQFVDKKSSGVTLAPVDDPRSPVLPRRDGASAFTDDADL